MRSIAILSTLVLTGTPLLLGGCAPPPVPVSQGPCIPPHCLMATSIEGENVRIDITDNPVTGGSRVTCTGPQDFCSQFFRTYEQVGTPDRPL